MTSRYLQRPLRSLEQVLAERRAAQAEAEGRRSRTARRVLDGAAAPGGQRIAARRPDPGEEAARGGPPAPG